MEKIKTADRRMVLLKGVILAAVPIPVTVLFVMIGVIGRAPALYVPPTGEYIVTYMEESVYPDASEQKLTLAAARGGHASLAAGDSVLWKADIYPDGMYRAQTEESPPFYTLFWLPTYFRALPPLRKGWLQELSQNSMMDLTGFLGEPGKTYAFKVREEKGWYTYPGSLTAGQYVTGFTEMRGLTPLLQNWQEVHKLRTGLQEVFFIDTGGAVAGRAGYDTANGVMVYAVSFARQGKSMTLIGDTIPRRTLAPLLLPFVLFIATVLASYEIFWSSLRPRKEKLGLSPSVEFAILGYSAILVDLYFDFIFHSYTGDPIFILIHAGMAVLLWYRLGWWSLLPIMETILGLASLTGFGTLHQAFAFFPGSVGTWLVALMVQGRVSPGHLPDRILLRFRT